MKDIDLKFKKKLSDLAIDLLMSDKELLSRLIVDKYVSHIDQSIDFDVKSFVEKFIIKTIESERNKIIKEYELTIKDACELCLENIKLTEEAKKKELLDKIAETEDECRRKIASNGVELSDVIDSAIKRSRKIIDKYVLECALATTKVDDFFAPESPEGVNMKQYVTAKLIKDLEESMELNKIKNERK